jgi:hypothetical protein
MEYEAHNVYLLALIEVGRALDVERRNPIGDVKLACIYSKSASVPPPPPPLSA